MNPSSKFAALTIALQDTLGL